MSSFDFDTLIVGCGLSGAVIARHLAEKARRSRYGNAGTTSAAICTTTLTITEYSYRITVRTHSTRKRNIF